MKVPGWCDTQKLLAQDANNCSHSPPAICLFTLCEPVMQSIRRSQFWPLKSYKKLDTRLPNSFGAVILPLEPVLVSA